MEMACLNNPNPKCKLSLNSNNSLSTNSNACDEWQSKHCGNNDRLSSNSIASSKTNRSENSDYSELFAKCDYFDALNHSCFKNKISEDLFLIHFNIRSLQKHIDELTNYLSGFKNQPEIIAISETKLREGNLNRNIDLKGYNFVHSDSKTFAGGEGIYIKNTLNYGVNQCSKNIMSNTEHLWVDIITSKNPVTIGVVYRHPDD